MPGDGNPSNRSFIGIAGEKAKSPVFPAILVNSFLKVLSYLLRQVILNAHQADLIKLRFQPVDMCFFIVQD